MSETYAYVGKLTPVKLKGLSVDEWIQKKLQRTELKFGDSWLSELQEEYYDSPKSYFYDETAEVLYRVKRTAVHPESIAVAHANCDGTIDFVVAYHDGGCSFSEALSEAVTGEL